MNKYRIAGAVLTAGLALFLLTVLIKLLLVAAAIFLLVRVVGGRLLGRSFGSLSQGGRWSTRIISIDNPTHRAPAYRTGFERVVSVG